MKIDYSGYVQFYQLTVGIDHLDRYEVSNLDQLAYDNPDGVVS
jgi:hypothetical protein